MATEILEEERLPASETKPEPTAVVGGAPGGQVVQATVPGEEGVAQPRQRKAWVDFTPDERSRLRTLEKKLGSQDAALQEMNIELITQQESQGTIGPTQDTLTRGPLTIPQAVGVGARQTVENVFMGAPIFSGPMAMRSALDELKEDGLIPKNLTKDQDKEFIYALMDNDPTHPTVVAMAEKLKSAPIDWQQYRDNIISQYEQARGASIEELQEDFEVFKRDNPTMGFLIDFIPTAYGAAKISKPAREITEKVIGESAESIVKRGAVGAAEGLAVGVADMAARRARGEKASAAEEAAMTGLAVSMDAGTEIGLVPLGRKAAHLLKSGEDYISRGGRWIIREAGKAKLASKQTFNKLGAKYIGELPESLIEEAYEPRNMFEKLKEEAYVAEKIKGKIRNAVTAVETVENHLSQTVNTVTGLMRRGELNSASAENLFLLRMERIKQQLKENNSWSPKMQKIYNEAKREFSSVKRGMERDARGLAPSGRMLSLINSGMVELEEKANTYAQRAVNSLVGRTDPVRLNSSVKIVNKRGKKETVQLVKWIDDEIESLKVMGEAPEAESTKAIIKKLEGWKRKIDKGVDELGQISLEPEEALGIFNDIRNVTKQVIKENGKTTSAGISVVTLRKIFSDNLKEYDPEYKRQMKLSEEHKAASRAIRARFGSDNKSVAQGIYAAATGSDPARLALEDLAVLTDGGQRVIDELDKITSSKRLLDKTKEIDSVDDVVERSSKELSEFEDAVAKEKSALITEDDFSRAKRMREHQAFITEDISHMMLRQGQEVFENMKETKPDSVIRNFIKGWDNLQTSETIQTIANNMSDEDIIGMAKAIQNDWKFSFDRNPLSQNSALIYMMITSGAGAWISSVTSNTPIWENSGTISGVSLGVSLLARHYGPRRARYIMRQIAENPNPPTVRDIKNMGLTKKEEEFMIDGLERFWKEFVPGVSGAVAIDDSMQDQIRLMIDKSGLSKTEKAKAKTMLHKDKQAELELIRKLTFETAEKKDKAGGEKKATEKIVDELRSKPGFKMKRKDEDEE